MAMSEANYERIGRWLDGEPIELTSEERMVADEIRRDQLVLDVPIDPRRQHQAMDHARRRMTAELARPSRRKRYLALLTSVEAAAVAALLLVTWTVHMVANGTGSADLVEVYTQAAAEIRTLDEIDVLQDELNYMQADIIADVFDDPHEQLEIDDLQLQLNDYNLYDPMETWTGS